MKDNFSELVSETSSQLQQTALVSNHLRSIWGRQNDRGKDSIGEVMLILRANHIRDWNKLEDLIQNEKLSDNY